MHGDLLWIDLSTFDVDAAKKFYGGLFKWTFETDQSGYHYAYRGRKLCTALYEMPPFFQKKE